MEKKPNNKEILQDRQLPISLKKTSNGPMCVANNDLWLPNMVSMTNKLRTAQREMERKMLDLKLQDKIPCSEIRKRTKITDII